MAAKCFGCLSYTYLQTHTASGHCTTNNERMYYIMVAKCFGCLSYTYLQTHTASGHCTTSNERMYYIIVVQSEGLLQLSPWQMDIFDMILGQGF